MIVSHVHRFIFIKTRKTAGTSVEIALSKYCGPDDIITRITPEDEALRTELGHRGPQNYAISPRYWRAADLVRALWGERPGRFYNHMPAAKIRARLGTRIWNSYYKIAFERNPWDLVVSAYFWHYGRADALPPIGTFIASEDVLTYSNFPIYSIDGRVAVDHVGRYEDLPAELARFAKQVGLPEVPVLPRAKTAFRTDRRHYADCLGQAERERIGQLFKREIDHFGYTFEERSHADASRSTGGPDGGHDGG
jgi:hypothetical protein